jgi:hypothetical protein
MKSIKGFALGLAVGIAVAVGTVGLAQTTKPADQTGKTESCCTSCCCQGDSCAMHGQMDHAKAMKQADAMKHSDGQMKAHSPEGGCCCCSGDSCQMQLKKQAQTKPAQE